MLDQSVRSQHSTLDTALGEAGMGICDLASHRAYPCSLWPSTSWSCSLMRLLCPGAFRYWAVLPLCPLGRVLERLGWGQKLRPEGSLGVGWYRWYGVLRSDIVPSLRMPPWARSHSPSWAPLVPSFKLYSSCILPETHYCLSPEPVSSGTLGRAVLGVMGRGRGASLHQPKVQK